MSDLVIRHNAFTLLATIYMHKHEPTSDSPDVTSQLQSATTATDKNAE